MTQLAVAVTVPRAMPPRPTLSVLALCLSLSAAPLLASELPGSAAGEVLVLRNGQVLTGTVTRLGDRFIIVLGDNAEINLPASDVAQYCRSLDEAYQRKREEVRPQEIDDRLELAEWCLAQGLTARAADQLLAARLMQPDNRRVASIERRLVTAPAPRATDHGEAVADAPSVETLERLTKSLDPAIVERFVSSVQPVLLNRCSTSGCHGAGGTSRYRLLRPSVGELVSRRFTQRNLHATLGQIDPAQPDASPLLTVPLTAHAAVDKALFDDRNRQQYEAIAAWVQIVAKGNSHATDVADAPPANMADFPSHVLMQRNGARRRERGGTSPSRERVSPDASAPSSKPDAGERGPIARDRRSDLFSGYGGATSQGGSSGVNRAENGVRETGDAVVGPDFTPRDEFDPEIFNRLYLDPQREARRR